MGEVLKLKNLSNLINKDYHPQEKFFGLSQLQIDWIWQNRFSCQNLIFSFLPDSKSKKISSPLLQQLLYVLSIIKEKQLIASTQNGNFKRDLVQLLYLRFFQGNGEDTTPPNSEEYVWQIVRLRFLLIEMKLIEYQKKKFFLTTKGERTVSDINSIYEELVETLANQWNWAQGDACRQINFIQDSATFCLYHVFQSAKNWKAEHEIGFEFLKAFPFMGMDFNSGTQIEVGECILAYCIRFLEHFCVPLGLIDTREKTGKFGAYSEYKVSSYFTYSMHIF